MEVFQVSSVSGKQHRQEAQERIAYHLEVQPNWTRHSCCFAAIRALGIYWNQDEVPRSSLEQYSIDGIRGPGTLQPR
jgi:hypothetical protein